jgi:hypothetical protein
MMSDLNVHIAVSDIEQWGILAVLVFVFLTLSLGKALFLFLEKNLAGSGRRYLDHVVTAKTIANFSVAYRMRLEVKRVKTLDYLVGMMFDAETVRDEFNRFFFNPPFEKGSFRSRLGWPIGTKAEARLAESPRAFICREVKRNGEKFVQDISLGPLLREVLADPQLIVRGCKMTVDELREELPDRLIEENYAMLTDEQKNEVLPEERYNELDEILAVAVLRRRLDFVGAQSKQTHDSSMILIQTERAGRRVKISWQFKPEAPQGYDLLGFRRTGGFFADQWDENNNGTLVIHGKRGAALEAIEPLQEGETYYYTFILKPSKADTAYQKYAIARFQMTITADETELIESTIRRIEKAAGGGREQISHALRELNLAVEYHEAIDEVNKSLKEKVRRKKLPAEEEERQIEIIDDLVRTKRSKYEI